MRKDVLNYWAVALALGIASAAGHAKMNAGPSAQTKFAAPKPCRAASLAGLKLDGLQTKFVTVTPEGSFTPPGSPSGARLPAFCRVEAVVTTVSDSVINFEVWIPPTESWNGKLVVTGNGGYSNALSYGEMARAVRQGYAAIGGDTGHQTSTPDDLLWGVGSPEKIIDWGSRSIHSITEAGKRIIEWMQGNPARRAYFNGCSTGGHQAYAEIQRYPKDFDGVIAGAPGNNRVRLNAGFLWQFLSNHNSNDDTTPIIPASKLPLITKAVVAACDRQDGVVDGVVDDPRSCDFDPSPISDAEHNLLSALDRWVEKGLAPEKVIASKVINGATVRTRPLCPYPKRAVYKGSGSTDDAANFICRSAPARTVRPQR
ncbi:MAG TPA: tannase/feruloyl esterase family alpha/beta hydrolase [Blastocatellia bacterium]|nr:tannase/feruloyl esterase family alpha/beta hydrolase [Blastocatellia bacterium]